MDQDTEGLAQERLLRRAEASRYLVETWRIPCSVGALAKLAVVGGGPEYRKAGRTPLYPQDALDDYARSKLSRRVRTTAELRESSSADVRLALAEAISGFDDAAASAEKRKTKYAALDDAVGGHERHEDADG